MSDKYEVLLFEEDEDAANEQRDIGFREILRQASFLSGKALTQDDLVNISNAMWDLGRLAYKGYLFEELQKTFEMNPMPLEEQWRFRIFPNLPDC